MKKICKDCGTEFELSDAEIGFYNSKGLELPKRCKSCRDMNNGKITSGAMGSRTTSNFNSNSHSSRNYSSNNYNSNNYNSNRRSSNGYSAGSSSGSSYASGNAGGTGGNKKMIGIFIAAIALVVIIGVIATVKSLSRNSNSNYVADNSMQTNVSDLAATNDGINDTAGDSKSSLEVEDSDGDKENADGENADGENNDGESADVENSDSDSATESDSENTSGNAGSGTTDASSQGNASSSQGGASAEQQSTPTQETTTTPQEPTSVVEETAPVQVTYYFRNSNLLNQHYEKHGIEMGFDSAQSYQAAASAVINNPNALCKTEAEDGDYVYYVEATNEFVVLSTDGYIRTYFLPSGGKAYYDRQ